MERLDAGRVPSTVPFAHVQTSETQACSALSLIALKLPLRVPYSSQLENILAPGHWSVEKSCCSPLPSKQTLHLHVPLELGL